MAFTTVESLDESVRKRLYDEFVVYDLYDSNGVQHCRRCNISTTPQWRKGPDGRNTLCNACGVKFANALRKVVGVGAGEYVAGPSEAARIVRKRQSVHSMPEHKHKKYKMEEPLMQKHHYKPSKPKKRRPIPSRDDEVSGGALTPGQRRSGRPLKPSKVFAEYSVYHDDESVEETSSSEPSSMPSPRIPAHKPSRGESEMADLLLMMRDVDTQPAQGGGRGGNAAARYTSSYGGAYPGTSEDEVEEGYSGGGQRRPPVAPRSGGLHRGQPSDEHHYEEEEGGDATSDVHHAPQPPPSLLHHRQPLVGVPPPMPMEEYGEEEEGGEEEVGGAPQRVTVGGRGGVFRAPDLGKYPMPAPRDARSAGRTCKECKQAVSSLKGMGMCKACYNNYWRMQGGGGYEAEPASHPAKRVVYEYDPPLSLVDELPQWQSCSTINQLTAVVIDHLLAVLHDAKQGETDEQMALQHADQALSSYRGLALTMQQRPPSTQQRPPPPTATSAHTPPSDTRTTNLEEMGGPPVEPRRGGVPAHHHPEGAGLAAPLFGRSGRGGRGGGGGGGVPWYHGDSAAKTPPPAARKRITSGVRPIQLLVNSGLLKQGERVCYRTKTGPAKLWGTIHGYDILCDGCGKLNSCLEFERCAGSNNKKPTRHIFTESMRCMQDMIAEAKSVNAPGNAGPIIVPRFGEVREMTPPTTASTPQPQQQQQQKQVTPKQEANGADHTPGAPTPSDQSPHQQDPASGTLSQSPAAAAAMAAAVAAHAGGMPMQLSHEAQTHMQAAVANIIPSEALVALQQQQQQQQHGQVSLGAGGPAGGPADKGPMQHTTLMLQPGVAGQPSDAMLVGYHVSETGQMQPPVTIPVSITVAKTEEGIGQ